MRAETSDGSALVENRAESVHVENGGGSALVDNRAESVRVEKGGGSALVEHGAGSVRAQKGGGSALVGSRTASDTSAWRRMNRKASSLLLLIGSITSGDRRPRPTSTSRAATLTAPRSSSNPSTTCGGLTSTGW